MKIPLNTQLLSKNTCRLVSAAYKTKHPTSQPVKPKQPPTVQL
ncbi:hypothetical protein [Pseudoalteromonas luteoviolacea]|nr:hypothetical protein [Pseudoalteromonas luteoviolacea]